MTSTQEFTEFAQAVSPRLLRTAFLLCGDWHTSEDLAQATLAKVYASWRRVSQQPVAQAYATRILVNTYLAALATLPAKSRAVVVLRYWGDLSVDQVAEVLGCSAGNVKSQSARALDKLRAVLGEAMTGVPAAPSPKPREKGTLRQ
ncbi:MAG TPA: SigE family RNA polymerase sigma factor [Streptosporangiaceae bacterium]